MRKPSSRRQQFRLKILLLSAEFKLRCAGSTPALPHLINLAGIILFRWRVGGPAKPPEGDGEKFGNHLWKVCAGFYGQSSASLRIRWGIRLEPHLHAEKVS